MHIFTYKKKYVIVFGYVLRTVIIINCIMAGWGTTESLFISWLNFQRGIIKFI